MCCIGDGGWTQSSIGAETRGQRGVKGYQTWITSSLTHPLSPDASDVMQSWSVQMSVRGDFGLLLQNCLKMICVGALGLSVKSCLAGDDGERAFVTAQRGAASHHSTQG